jgi:arylsulfatase A-like enzyme/outer membrane protein assembly factor BamB
MPVDCRKAACRTERGENPINDHHHSGKMRYRNLAGGLACLFLCLVHTANAQSFEEASSENWHQWRGPNANGFSESAKGPVEWDNEKNIQWKVAMGGSGSSTPIIWGDKVFLLTAINTGQVDPSLPRPEDQPERVFGIKHPNTSYEFAVLCLSRETGKEIWRRVATTLVPHEGHHNDNNFASASPTTDGKRLYCWFGSAGLFCYSLEGELLWNRKLGTIKMGASLGEGCSPVLHEGKLIIVRDHQGESSIEVLVAGTGKTLWRKKREGGNGWSTPAVVKHSGRVQIITTSSGKGRGGRLVAPGKVISYDLGSGEIIWQCSGLTDNAIPCPVVEDGVVYCMTGYQGSALLALPLSAKGDITGSESILWTKKRGTPYVPSPLLYDGRLYFTQSNQNLLSCLDAKDGSEIINRERLPGMSGIYSSPVGANGLVYVTDRNGTTLVLKRARKLEVIATNKLGDTVHSSPAIAGNQLFIRGRRFLYCIARAEGENPPEVEVNPPGSAVNGKDKRPNVVTLLVDDLGYRDLGCYGGPVKTPVLDRLAAAGVRFTDFHSGAATCCPSRATFLTGRHHYRTGVYSVITERLHRMHLLESETTIAEVLKKNGYGTAHFGKWHLGMPVQKRNNPTPADHGFDYWFGVVNGAGPSHKNPTNFLRNGERVGTMEGYSCQIVVDEALTWLDEKRDADEPFFLNLWFNEPHDPIAAPDEIVSQYGALNEREAIYSGTIDNTDRAIGRLVARLETLGELDNTIIVYSSDNGSYLQERNGELRGKKGALFEGGHRVPGIVYWKDGIPGGRVEDEPAGAVDLLPTLCGLIGIDKPRGVHLDGSDLAPLLTGTGSFARHQPLFWMSDANMVMRMGDYTLFSSGTAKSPVDFKTADRLMKQIKEVLGNDLEKELGGMDLRSRLFNGRFANLEANRLQQQHRDLYYFNEAWIPKLKKSEVGRVQLYDLSKDLGQQNDIAKERPELVARMKKQAAAIYASVMSDAPEWIRTEDLATLKKPRRDEPQGAATGAPDTAKLLARIDKNNLPEGYHGSRHQPYVDKRMAELTSQQRQRIGRLWKEKRRLHPKMRNVGGSFVKILEYVATKEKTD